MAPPSSEQRPEGSMLKLSRLKWKKQGKDGKPTDSKFTQQRLPYWQPILTPRIIIPFHFFFGCGFIVLGTFLSLTALGQTSIIFEYTNCDLQASENFTQFQDAYNAEWSYNNATSNCTIRFTLTENITGPIQIYYGLTNFYQNYQSYVSSLYSNQLMGQAVPASELSSCSPLDSIYVNDTGVTMPIYPCGLIANSVFNDTFSQFYQNGSEFTYSEKGIAETTDFGKYQNTQYAPDAVLPPPNWSKHGGRYTNETLPKLSEDEHFMVWMRIAGTPNFWKIYGTSNDTLTVGTWSISVISIFPVREFGGTKLLIITTPTWLEGIGPFLGVSYLFIGSVLLITGIILLAFRYIKPRKMADSSYLSWNKKSD